MNTAYDVVIVGAGTCGTYFAKRMADAGFSVLVIDKTPEADLGKRLDIFHIDEELFERFGVPRPKAGDEDYVTLFEYGITMSGYGRYPKRTDYPFLVMQLPLFMKRLVKWARENKVEYSFETEFNDFIFDDKGRISGVRVTKDGVQSEISARLVADCSGIPSVARRKLPDGYGVPNFEITPRDQFYVILRYVTLENPERDRAVTSTGYPFYKTWVAPQLDPNGAIIGVGANLSYEFAEKCYQQFAKDIELPPHTLDRIQKGSTPYRRPPASFVADGFVALGDCACMTKPFSGEGITSAWVLCDIAAKNIPAAMKDGKYPTRKAMWKVNSDYMHTQGADFAELMATLIGGVDFSREENDYMFKKDIAFSSDIMTKMNRNFANTMSVGESLKTGVNAIGGVLSGKLKLSSLLNFLKMMGYAGKLKNIYRAYPDTPDGYDEWVRVSEEVWAKVGTMADVCRL